VAYADRKISEYASKRAGTMAFNMALTRQQLREQKPLENRIWKVRKNKEVERDWGVYHCCWFLAQASSYHCT
jgi:hypothetical protein